MPIIGRTDKFTDRKGYPMLGRIYKGMPKRKKKRPDGSEYEIMGLDTDHFRVKFELENIVNPDAEQLALLQHYQHQWLTVYGEKPRTFDDVRLYYPTPDKAMESWYKAYDGKGLICQCDGVNRVKWWDNTAKRLSKEPTPCPFAQGGECECKPTGEIPLILMKFSLLTGIYGYFQLTTHSDSDIDNLHAAMCEVYAVTDDLTKVVFTLTRKPTPMNFVDEKTGERGKTTKSLLSLYGGQQYTRKYIVPPAAQAEYAALLGAGENDLIDPPPAQLKPPPVERFPLPGRTLTQPEITYDQAPDEPGPEHDPTTKPPVTVRLSLKKMPVRVAFIKAAQGVIKDLDAADILETCGVESFNDLDWYEAAELLKITIDPPAELLAKGK